MLDIQGKHIALQQSCQHKQDAIAFVATQLEKLGYVEKGYAQAMQQREQQTCTYLGQGIAIPHGTLEARSLVKKTGVFIAQFPQGVDWGSGQKAFLVIGIGAKSDEHLLLLRHLTSLLSDENRVQTLSQTTEIATFLAMFQATLPPIEPRLIHLDIAYDDVLALMAENVNYLQQYGYCDEDFLADIASLSPLQLSEKCFFSDSPKGNKQNGIAFARSSSGKMVITTSQIDDRLNTLLHQLDADVLLSLQQGSKEQIIAIFNTLLDGQGEITMPPCKEQVIYDGTFKIRNLQGLHARPAGVLVNTAKQFHSKISVKKAESEEAFVNAKSLMNVLTLGVSCHQYLHIKAEGKDAKEAIDALENAINTGLGEKCDF